MMLSSTMQDSTKTMPNPIQTLPPSVSSGEGTSNLNGNQSYPVQDSRPMLEDGIISSKHSSPAIDDEFVASLFSGKKNSPHVDDDRNGSPQGPSIRQYDLRPGPRAEPDSIWSTWHDADDTGNYDPNAKPPKRPCLKRRSDSDRPLQRTDTLGEQRPKRAKIISPLLARREGLRFVVTLLFQSAQAKAQLQQFQGHDNWPIDSYNKLALPDPDRINIDDNSNQLFSALCEEPGSYKLRSRYNNDSSFRPFQESSPIQEDLTGHPAARGCVACYKLGETCSLLKTPGEYPCAECAGECDCELTTPAKWKRTCEPCSKKRKKCSYHYRPHDEAEHNLPCLECNDAGYHCIAGPRVDDPKDPPIRIDLDKDWQNYRHQSMKAARKERQYIACTFCRQEKRRCSLGKRDDPPCKACKKANLSCTFEALDSPNQGGPQHKSTTSIEISGRAQQISEIFRPGAPIPHWSQIPEDSGGPPTPTVIDLDPDTDVPDHTIQRTEGAFTIRTAYCHPIQFNYDTQQDCCGPCHFCVIPHYAIFGLGFRDVDVVEWEPGRGYNEVDGGHAAEGEEPSRMCIACTYTRLRICSCPRHEVASLPQVELTPERMNTEEAYKSLLPGSDEPQGSGQKIEYKWCSICPSLALYECVTRQETDVMGQPIHPKAKAVEGCGLLLCDACAMAITEKEGDLQAVLKKGLGRGSNEDGRWPLGWRADAEFLSHDGLLMAAVFADH